MSSHHVLVLGGHGKVAQLLTPLLLKRSWTVTSVIRSKDQVPAIQKLADGQHQGRLNVLVESIEELKDQAGAQAILDKVKPDYVVFSAGAGGKGAPERVGFPFSFNFSGSSTPSSPVFPSVVHVRITRPKAS